MLASPKRVPSVGLLFALDPDADLARLFAGLHVHDARATADGAILRVGLALAATEIDRKLVRLSAEGTFDDSGGATFALGHHFSSMAARQRKRDRSTYSFDRDCADRFGSLVH
jgi:hypothetical protein